MRRNKLELIFGASLLMVTASVAQQTTVRLPEPGTSQHGQIGPANRGLPLTFEANLGQTDAQAKFVARGKGYSAFLTAGGMVLSLHSTKTLRSQQAFEAAPTQVPSQSSKTTLEFNLLGATQNPTVVGEEPQPGRVNYFIGKDPKRWRTNVPTYARVRYKNVYPGVDLVYYGNPRQLEYDFEVSVGGNPNLIQFEIKGANEIQLDPDGNLVLNTNSGELHFQSPIVYQRTGGQRVAVEGGYAMKDATHIGFRVAQYDPSKPLVIDPTLVYSTYLGGSGDYDTHAIAIDGAGSIYVTGDTDTDDFPVTGSGLLAAFSSGGFHAFIGKLDATGSTLVYADYLGGSGDDTANALVVDSTGKLYVAGNTTSSDFPTVNSYQAANAGQYNGFLTELSADGSSLVYSTYLGGSGWDWPTSIALDSVGDALVAGMTTSKDFPIASAFQPTVSANQDGLFGWYGFVTKFSPDGSSLVYSTYFGGSAMLIGAVEGVPYWFPPFSRITGLALDASGNAYVAGYTDTYDFPVTAGAYLTTDSMTYPTAVGIVAKFNASGGLAYSTFLYGSGGNQNENYAIAVDSSGSAYVAGAATSDGTFPITSTSICDPGVYGLACSYTYVTKLDPTGSSLLYSTFLGPDNYSTPVAIALDASNNAYVLGDSYGECGSSFTMVAGIESCAGMYSLLLVEIDPTASRELFATYLGGSGDGQYPAGLALDSAGNIYVGGLTFADDFPTTTSAFQETLNGDSNPFLLKIAPDPAPAFSASPFLLQYTGQEIGSTSGAATALLRNMGSTPLSISSITVSGDFAETNNCGNSVPAAGSCTFSVTFAPTAAGPRSGSITIKDNAAGSPHIISLIGNSPGGVLTLTPSSLAFPSQAFGTPSATQTVTLGNNGSTALKLDAIQVSGDFAQTNNCPAALPATSSCVIQITFTPTNLGNRSGTLTVSDNVQAPRTLNLSGVGSDFILASSPSRQIIKAGEIATYHVTVAPVGGSFANAVSLTCGGLPAQTACSLSPSLVTPGDSGATATLTVTTSASVTANRPVRWFDNSPLYAIWISLQGIGLFGIVVVSRRFPSKKRGSLRFLIVALIFMTACAGGTGVVAPPPHPGTPAGIYKITITGNSGARHHSDIMTLTVQ